MSNFSPPPSPHQNRSERGDRPRAITGMSYASTHSHRSSKSREEKKLELVETSRDKRRLEGKSDPTKALQEREPGVNLIDLKVATTTKSKTKANEHILPKANNFKKFVTSK